MVEVLCFGFYGLGLAVGFVLSYRERQRLKTELLAVEADLEESRDQMYRYYEHPQQFLDDVALIRAVAGSPVYGDYGRLVDDPKSTISLN